MNDFTTSLFESLLSALIFAGLVFLYQWSRNLRLESKLKKGLSWHGVSQSRNGIGVSLHNRTNQEVRVRQVLLVLSKGGSWVLNFEGPEEAKDHWDIVTLPPFSDETWFIPPSFRKATDVTFSELKVEFSYTTLLGDHKLVTVSGNKPMLKHLYEDWTKKEKIA